MDLPILSVEIGDVSISSNYKKFEEEANNILNSLNTNLVTSGDFVTAKKDIKDIKKFEKSIIELEEYVLNKVKDVNDIITGLRVIKSKFANVRLALEKSVKNETELIKKKILDPIVDSLNTLVEELKFDLPEICNFNHKFSRADFSEVVKNKKTEKSFKEAAEDLMANIVRSLIKEVETINHNSEFYKSIEEEHHFLFPDINDLLATDKDTFKEIIINRLDNFKKEQVSNFTDNEVKESVLLKDELPKFEQSDEIGYMFRMYEDKIDECRNLRKQICEKIAGDKEGVFNHEMLDGRKLQCTITVDKKIDWDLFDRVSVPMCQHGFDTKYLVNSDGSLHLENYGSLPEEVRKYFSACLKISKVRYKLEVV